MHSVTDERVIDALNGIARANDGIIPPETVVEAARSKSSVLHKYFTWDNTEAARMYRIYQARQLLRATIHYIQLNGDRRPVRVFVSLTNDRTEGGYRSLVNVLGNKSMREQLLADALKELAQFEAKYGHLQELSEVFMASASARAALQPWAA